MCETLVENRPPPETGHDQELSRAPAVAARLARSIAPRLYATPYHVATVAAVTTGSTSPDPRVDNVDPPRPPGRQRGFCKMSNHAMIAHFPYIYMFFGFDAINMELA